MVNKINEVILKSKKKECKNVIRSCAYSTNVYLSFYACSFIIDVNQRFSACFNILDSKLM